MDEMERLPGYVVYLDPKNEYDYRVDNPDKLRDWPGEQCNDVTEIDFKKAPKWVVHLKHHRKEQLDYLFGYIESIQEERAKKGLRMYRITIIIDEVHLYCSPQSICDGLEKFIRLGRSLNIHIITLSQRPADVNGLVYTQATYYVFFFLSKRDIKYLSERCSMEVPQISYKSYEWAEYNQAGIRTGGTYKGPEQNTGQR